MKIVIENIIFSIQKIGGISVVWFEFVKRLNLDHELEVEFIEYNNCDRNILRKNVDLKYTTRLNIVLFNLRKYFSPKFNIKNKYIFHSSNYRISRDPNAVNVITIHDFLYFKDDWKGIYIWLVRKFHRYQMRYAINKSDYVICISNSTLNDLFHYMPKTDRNKVRVIYNGVSENYSKLNLSEKLKDGIFAGEKFFLFVGSRSKYKNFEFVIQLMATLNSNLVIVGSKLSIQEEKFVNNFLSEKQYKVLSNLTNLELNLLYNQAQCLLYPSEFEGFGIPIVEAQRAGCPVVALNRSSIPEVIGDSTLLIDELNIEKFKDHLLKLEDPEIRDKIVNLGLKNSERFSWDKMYLEVKKLYIEIKNKTSK